MLLAAALFWIAVGTLAMTISITATLAIGVWQLKRLRDYQVPADFSWPPATIVVPARNEERNIEEALSSLLKLEYDNLQIVVVDDRSTDRTGAILDRMAAGEPRLAIRHITELPAGWLGKNHAMHLGAEEATGDWLLFTDADIVMEASTLRRAIAYAVEWRVDHLPMVPSVHVPGWLLQSFVVLFTIYFSAYFKPWRAKNPRSKCYVGVGAFNLVRAEAYRAVGGFATIAMRPDDDVKFGKLIKKAGLRQEAVDGVGMIRVEWYSSIRELIGGLEKNAFAGVDYRIDILVGSSLVALLVNVWPFAGMCVTRGATQGLYAATAALFLLLGVSAARGLRVNPLVVLLFPIAVLLFIYIQWRTMLLTLSQGGIRWRGTLYPLAELKANRV